jgi:hypothetical protein
LLYRIRHSERPEGAKNLDLVSSKRDSSSQPPLE